MNHKKTIVFVLFFLFSSVLTVTVQSTGLFDTDSVVFNCDNENYTMNPSVASSVNSVYVSDSWIRFNNTDFNVTSTNDINITISYLNSNISAASSGDTVLSFSAESSGGLVYFNLSGFDANQSYAVYRDGSNIEGLTSNADGNISFTNTVWSDHDFVIKEGHNYVQVTYGRGALVHVTPMSFTVLGMVGLIGLVLVAAAVIMYVTRMGSGL